MAYVEISGNRKTLYIDPDFSAQKQTVPENRQAYIEYKALSFVSENLIAQANYNIKGVRAVFDPDLGPSGGYRCPKGSQYGGYITDRFGRGCGGGIIRRVGRALANTGMRLEDFADRRDARRRNRAVQRRMKPKKPGQRRERIAQAMERGARRLVDAYPVNNLGPNSGGRPQRRNIPAPPKKRTAVVKPKPKPKRVVKPQPQKKPARPQGKVPVKPKVPNRPRVPKQPSKKPSARSQGAARASEALAQELVSSKPAAGSRKKLAQVIVEGLPDKKTRKAALDALIDNIEKKLNKLGELPDLSKLSGEERKRAERNIEELRDWMSELNAAKAIRKNLDSGPSTSLISRKLRDQIDRQNDALSQMSTRELIDRLKQEGFLRSSRSRRKIGGGVDTLLDDEEIIAEAQRAAARREAANAQAQRAAARSARSEVSQRKPKPTVSKPVQRPDNSRSPKSSSRAGAIIRPFRADNRRKQILEPFAPIPSTPGALPVPQPIANPQLKTLAKAKEHFDNGGDLAEIPHQFWHAVLNANAGLRDPDGVKPRVRKIAANGGAIKQVEIFVFVDKDGNDLVNQGVVFNRARAAPGEAIREAMAQNIMVALGLDAAPARMDGKDGGRGPYDVWAVMPFAWNFAPDGKAVGRLRGRENYKKGALRDLPDKAVKERLAGLLFNYAMGITDRHGQNGMADVFEDENGVLRPFVMPIDLGWFGGGRRDFFGYAGADYMMDYDIFSDILDLVQNRQNRNNPLTVEQRIQLHEDLMVAYDEFLARLDVLASMDEDDFKKTVAAGYHIDENARIFKWDQQQKSMYEFEVGKAAVRALDRLKIARDELRNARARFVSEVLGGDAVNA